MKMLNSSQITKKLERFPNNGMREASLIEEYDLLDITLSINGTKIRIPPRSMLSLMRATLQTSS